MAVPASTPLLSRIGALTEKSRSVLALATIARLWEDHFQGGWVTQADVARQSVHFERVREGEASDANRIGFVRARNSILTDLPDLQPEQRVLNGVAAFRIGAAAPDAVREWVVGEGPTLLERAFWESYLAPYEPWQIWLSSVEAYATAVAGQAHIFRALDVLKYATQCIPDREQFLTRLRDHATISLSGFGNVLIPAGELPGDSIARLESVYAGIGARYDERYLLRHVDYIGLCLILKFAEPGLVLDMGETRLKALLNTPLPVRTPADQLLTGRIHLDWVEWAFRSICSFEDGNGLEKAFLEQRRHHLQEAASRAQYLSHLDRSRLAIHRGLLQMTEARLCGAYEGSVQLMMSAERCFEDAFVQAQSAPDIAQVSLAMQYRAACIFQRSILDGHLRTEPCALMVNVLMAQARFLQTGAAEKELTAAGIMYYVDFTALYQATRGMITRRPAVPPVPRDLPLDLDWVSDAVRKTFSFRESDYTCLTDGYPSQSGTIKEIGDRH